MAALISKINFRVKNITRDKDGVIPNDITRDKDGVIIPNDKRTNSPRRHILYICT